MTNLEVEHCPGPLNEEAGKADACQTCPSKETCLSIPKNGQVDPDLDVITDRLKNIKHKLLVVSGKGGVGKSTVSTLLSHALSVDPDVEVGAMDLDLCGPSLPLMMGQHHGGEIHVSNDGWCPIYVADNLGVMSVQFLLPDDDSAVVWRAAKKVSMIKQFLKDVQWGDLDHLVIDTPPGTSDEHLTIVQFLREVGIDGAIVVTTPQETALLDVRREIGFCKKANIKVLGLIENMSGFVCPNCQGQTKIFKPTTGGGKQLAKEMDIPFLGSLPLDPRLAQCCDLGSNFLIKYPDSPTSQEILNIIDILGF